MIEQKQNDWIVNILGNQQLSTADFKAVGLNADNTSLQEEEVYRRSPKITENPLFKNDQGEFDDSKFHDFYQKAEFMYNMLANDTYLDKMHEQQTVYGKDDIFAPKEQRRTFEDTVRHFRSANPDRTTTGLVRVGVTEAPRWSVEEIAQTQKVLANPIEASKDPSKAIWHDSPNDSWTTDFFDTRVLATWDEDGEHEDPITGETVKHSKGQFKLNENGTYYYENLDGRDIYGRTVLNKMNTLTRDGSTWNKYDFFDSDDLTQKSIGGSIMKNLALVGSMFIPYVGPWIAGVSVASQLVGLSGTLGKMLLGSDSPTLSALEGWSKSVNRQTAKSQYAQENTWCWENFISLIGDVMGQLKEQRFLFEYAPAIIKGTRALGWKGISETKQAKMIEELAAKYKNLNEAKWTSLKEAREAVGKGITATEQASYNAMRQAETLLAKKDVDKFIESYQHIGSILSKGYMTAVTVGDTYGEAIKEGGATDIEATLLTLGYAAGEAAILNTSIGEWILPELKAKSLRTKKIIEIFSNAPKNTRSYAANADKKSLAKYWFNKGKDLASSVAVAGKGIVGQAVSGGLGEGVEEVSEELLADVVKSCYNTAQWLRGDNEKRMSAWDNAFDRYAMSFLGGTVGGGLTAVGTSFKMGNLDMTPEQARQELIYMLRHDQKNELYKALDKITLANPYLQNEVEEDGDGNLNFKPATNTSSNMDQDLKKAFKQNVEILDNIIKSEGIQVSDQTFLDQQTFKDIRLANLQQSAVAGLYLQDFNTLCSDIVRVKDEINNIVPTADSKQLTETQQSLLQKKQQELLALRQRKDQYLNGELAIDYVGKALFELTPIFSQYFTKSFFKDYVEFKYNRKLSDLSESEVKQYREEFDNWKETDFKNNVSVLAPLYQTMARKSGMFIQEFAKNYDNIRKNRTLKNLIQQRLSDQFIVNMQGIDPTTNQVSKVADLEQWINVLQQFYTRDSAETAMSLIYAYGGDKVKEDVKVFLDSVQNLDKNDPKYDEKFQSTSEALTNLISTELANNIETYLDEFVKTGAINPEIKHSLQQVLSNTQLWAQKLESGVRYLPSTERVIKTLNSLGYNGITPSTTLWELQDQVDYYDMADVFTKDDIYTLDSAYKTLRLPPKLLEQYTIADIDTVKQAAKDLSVRLDQQAKVLDGVTYTDTIQFIQNFIQTNSDSGLDMSKLIETVNSILDQNMTNLEGANLDGVIDQVNEGIEVLGWLQGLTLGAQSNPDVNLGNLIGYNVTMNEIAQKNHVANYEPLPVISQEDALIINQDIELVKNKLLQAKALYSINQGKKLTLQDRVSINKHFIDYNRMKKFIVNIGDDWAEKDRLIKAIEDAEVLKKYSEKRNQKSLTEEDKIKLGKEKASIEDTIYDFFNNEENKKKIQNGELYTLFKKGFNLYSSTSQLINEDTEQLDDNNFLWYLASRAAIKHSDFYGEFKQVLSDQIAPIPTQEESVFQNIAEILNGDVTTAFKDAYTKAALENFNNSSESERKRILIENLGRDEAQANRIIQDTGFINEDIFPIYSNIYLTEGIPGAGKSEAVDFYTVQVLKKFHPDLLSNVWVAHHTNSSASKLAKSLGVESFKTFDKNSLMSTIFSNYNTGRQKNNQGEYLYNKEDWIKDSESGRIIYKYKSDSIAADNVPSLIIIDEVSHYDQADLMLLDDFAKKNGITVITSGDFDQSSSTAVSKNWDNGVNDLAISPVRSHFKHSPKLGISMRTTNSQMNKTISSFQLNDKKKIDTYYYQGEEGLNGVKYVKSSDLDTLKKDIEQMIATSTEKIGLIYYSQEYSPVLDLVTKNYADKFELFEGTSAQGLEGQYYIVDVTGASKNTDDLKRDLYTAVTRAKQGAIVTGALPISLQSTQEGVTTNSTYSQAGLQRYSNKRKDLFNQVYATTSPLTYTPRKKADIGTAPKPQATVAPQSVQQPPTQVDWTNPARVWKITYDGEDYLTDGDKVAKEVNNETVEVSDDEASRIQGIARNLSNEPPENTLPNENTNQPAVDIEELNSEQSTNPTEQAIQGDGNQFDFTYLLHSHNTFELGMMIEDGKLDYIDDISRYKYRIDSAIGLAKIFEQDWKNPTLPVEFYIDMLSKLRGYLFSTADKNKLIENLSSVFNPNEDKPELEVESVDFGLMSAPNISKKNEGQKWGYNQDSKEFGIFDRHVDEKTIGNANPDSEARGINRKSINAVITLAGGKRVAIPLFVLGNLETYTRNPQSEVSSKLAQLYEAANGDSYKFHKSIIEDVELQKVPEVYNLAKLYLFTNAGFFKIDDQSWTPAKNLSNWGIQVNTDANSGGKFQFTGKSTPITDLVKTSGFTYSKQIYTSQAQIADNSGNVYDFAHIGHAFVLVSQDPSLRTDKEMQEQYERQILDPSIPKTVTLVYVTPPKVSVDTYLRNLFELVNEQDVDRRINIKKLGSHLSSYYIWKSLLPELKRNEWLKAKLGSALTEKLISEIERLNQIQDSRQLLNEVMSNARWEGVMATRVEQSIQNHLNYALLSVFSDMNNEIIPENLAMLTELINKNGTDGLYYSTKFKELVPPKNQVMVPLQSDIDNLGNTLYTINGLPFTINGKLDSSLFSQDKSFNQIIESFVNKIVPPSSKNPRETSRDTYQFIHPAKKSPSGQTIALEENAQGVTELKVEYHQDGVTINGKKFVYFPDQEVKKITVVSKADIKTQLQNKAHPISIMDNDVDIIYNEQVGVILTNPMADIQKYLQLSYLELIEARMSEYNSWDDTSKLFYANGHVVKVVFSRADLKSIGLDTFTISDNLYRLNFNFEGIAEIQLPNNVIMRFNRNTETAQLIKMGEESDTPNNLDNIGLDPQSAPVQLFNQIGWINDFVEYKQMYDWQLLSDMKGTEAVEDLVGILKNMDSSDPNTSQLKEIINYLQEDPEFCTRILKSI